MKTSFLTSLLLSAMIGGLLIALWTRDQQRPSYHDLPVFTSVDEYLKALKKAHGAPTIRQHCFERDDGRFVCYPLANTIGETPQEGFTSAPPQELLVTARRAVIGQTDWLEPTAYAVAIVSGVLVIFGQIAALFSKTQPFNATGTRLSQPPSRKRKGKK
jgi:hypothetical protein